MNPPSTFQKGDRFLYTRSPHLRPAVLQYPDGRKRVVQPSETIVVRAGSDDRHAGLTLNLLWVGCEGDVPYAIPKPFSPLWSRISPYDGRHDPWDDHEGQHAKALEALAEALEKE